MLPTHMVNHKVVALLKRRRGGMTLEKQLVIVIAAAFVLLSLSGLYYLPELRLHVR